DRDSLPAAFLPSRGVLFDLAHKEEAYVPPTLRLVKDEEPVSPAPLEEAPTAALVPEPTVVIHPLPKVEPKEQAPALGTTSGEPPAGAGPQERLGTAATDADHEVLDRQIVTAIQVSGY